MLNDHDETRVLHAMSIDDAYRVEQVLARNAHGTTELVTIDGAGPFVRKKIRSEQAQRGVWAALAECRCPYLPQVRATYEMPDWFVAVYDYVPGETLAARVERTGSLAADEAAAALGTICTALEELHAHGVIHRDVSPTNVVLASDGAHLLDLGLAECTSMRTEGHASSTARRTTTMGTWGFAAPEQYGFAQADARSDIYAAGAGLGFALTGLIPDADGYASALHDAQHIPPALCAVVEQACDFEPSKRHQTAAQLASAIAAAAQQAGTAAPDQSPFNHQAAESPTPLPAQPPFGSHGQASAPKDRAAENKRLLTRVFAIVGAAAVIVAAILFLMPGEAPESQDELTDGANTGTPSAADASGSASASTATARSTSAAYEPIELTESGWSVDSGYVYGAFALYNPNDDLAIEYPSVEMTGRDESGDVLFTETQTIGTIAPHQTLYFGAFAGNGTAPETVEFTVLEPDEWAVTQGDEVDYSFAFSPIEEQSDGLGGSAFTGDVSLKGDVPNTGTGQIAVTVVLRDDTGKIVWGGNAFVDAPEKGRAVPFEVIGPFEEVAYATAEAYAQPW